MVLVFLENVSVSRANFSARDRKFSVFPWNSSISARCERAHLKLGRIFNPTSKTRCSEASLGLRTGRREFLQNYRRWNSAKHARNTRKTRAKHAQSTRISACLSLFKCWHGFVLLSWNQNFCCAFNSVTAQRIWMGYVWIFACFSGFCSRDFSQSVFETQHFNNIKWKIPSSKTLKNRQISNYPPFRSVIGVGNWIHFFYWGRIHDF